MSGQSVKAANTRRLVPFLVELSEELYSDDRSEYDRLVKRTCKALDRFYSILYAADYFLSDVEKRALMQVLNKFSASLQQLRELARRQSVFAWQMTPKTHMINHFHCFSGVVNPRYLQNYEEESSVGTVAKVWKLSANGRYSRTVQRMVLLKRLVALMVRLETDGGV